MSAQGSAPRATLDLKVRVWGMGANNQPFFQNAMAQNVSATGACLYGIEPELKVGDVIGVQYETRKARCKVIWVVDAGALKKTQVGVQLVADQDCPWVAVLPADMKPDERTQLRPRQPQKIRAPQDFLSSGTARRAREYSACASMPPTSAGTAVMLRPSCRCPSVPRCAWICGSSRSASRPPPWFAPATPVSAWASNSRACPKNPKSAFRLTSTSSIPGCRSATKTANNAPSARVACAPLV